MDLIAKCEGWQDPDPLLFLNDGSGHLASNLWTLACGGSTMLLWTSMETAVTTSSLCPSRLPRTSMPFTIWAARCSCLWPVVAAQSTNQREP
jgi:hypothetical protein